jgi:hypothetical protein
MPNFTAPDGETFATQRELNKYVFRTQYTFDGREGECWIKVPGEVLGNPLKLTNLKGCQISIADHSEQVTIENCTQCQIFVGACCSTVFLRNCSQCNIASASRHVYFRDCSRIVAELYCVARPVLERSEQIQIFPWNTAFPGAFGLWRAARLIDDSGKTKKNQWNSVEDYERNELEGTAKDPANHKLYRSGPKNTSPFGDAANICGYEANPLRDRLPVGARVEARFEGQEHWFAGVVASSPAAPAAEAYAIDYDDGDKETGVLRAMVRPLPYPEEEKTGTGTLAEDAPGNPLGLSPRVWESCVLAAPLGEVWDLVKDLNLARFLPSTVRGCDAVPGPAGGGGNAVGSLRYVSFADGSRWSLRLLAVSEPRHEVSWELVSAEPAVTFTSRVDSLRLMRVSCSGQTVMVWKTVFSSDGGGSATQDCKYKVMEAFEDIRRALGTK